MLLTSSIIGLSYLIPYGKNLRFLLDLIPCLSLTGVSIKVIEKLPSTLTSSLADTWQMKISKESSCQDFSFLPWIVIFVRLDVGSNKAVDRFS